MYRSFPKYLLMLFSLSIGYPAAADEKDNVRAAGSNAECSCPTEGDWKVQNLEGWMDCTGPVNFKKSLKEVKDEGTIWILDEDCTRLFGEASQKRDEDVLMERNDSCGYAGRINGEEDGVNMVIDITWTVRDENFISGEMHAKPSLQGMMCEYYRPFEITFDDDIPEDDYEKRKKKMLEKLKKISETD